MRSTRAESWVVYETPVFGRPLPSRAVCGSAEWAALLAGRPGVFTLIRAGITNEGEAKRLARGTAGDSLPRGRPRRFHPAQVALPRPAA